MQERQSIIALLYRESKTIFHETKSEKKGRGICFQKYCMQLVKKLKIEFLVRYRSTRIRLRPFSSKCTNCYSLIQILKVSLRQESNTKYFMKANISTT